jgi:hypothetical protein
MKDFLKRFAQGELRLGRVEAFSDGLFAIVVTLACAGAESAHATRAQ